MPNSAPFCGRAAPYIHNLGTILRLPVIFMAHLLYSWGAGGRSLSRAETECDGTRKRTGGELKGKKANGGGSRQ